MTRDGREIKLTPKEIAVLEELLVAEGNVVSAEELLERAWDEHTDPFTNTVRVTVMTLRRKLGDPPVVETSPAPATRSHDDSRRSLPSPVTRERALAPDALVHRAVRRELADTFDAMLARRFVADASHELRTPLAIIRAEVDITLADPNATPAELRAMAETVRDATQRREALIDSLLVLARSDSADSPPSRSTSRRSHSPRPPI